MTTGFLTVRVDLDRLAEVVFVRCHHCTVACPFPFLYCPLFKEVTLRSLHLGSRESLLLLRNAFTFL